MKNGKKFDQGKTRMSLCFSQFAGALLGIAKVLTFGANKYPDPNTGDRGWENVENAVERYHDAFLRHYYELVPDLEVQDPEYPAIDKETGQLVIDHCITNLLFLRELMYRNAHDDLPLKEFNDVQS